MQLCLAIQAHSFHLPHGYPSHAYTNNRYTMRMIAKSTAGGQMQRILQSGGLESALTAQWLPFSVEVRNSHIIPMPANASCLLNLLSEPDNSSYASRISDSFILLTILKDFSVLFHKPVLNEQQTSRY